MYFLTSHTFTSILFHSIRVNRLYNIIKFAHNSNSGSQCPLPSSGGDPGSIPGRAERPGAAWLGGRRPPEGALGRAADLGQADPALSRPAAQGDQQHRHHRDGRQPHKPRPQAHRAGRQEARRGRSRDGLSRQQGGLRHGRGCVYRSVPVGAALLSRRSEVSLLAFYMVVLGFIVAGSWKVRVFGIYELGNIMLIACEIYERSMVFFEGSY